MDNKFKLPTIEERIKQHEADLQKKIDEIYEPILKEYEHKYSMRIKNNSDVLEEIKKLTEEYPNDQEFGEKVRTLLNNKK